MTVRALVTNDDGIDSPGLWALAGLAAELGLEVLVAAPAWENSGASASLAAVEDEGRTIVEPRAAEGLPAGATVVAVQAAPAFIVRAAVHGAFGPEPDIVLSGVNRGPNTGHAVLHSGTVGAAMTGATHGRRSLAVSLGVGGDQWHWETAITHARPVAGWLLDQDEPMVLNLNVPNTSGDAVRGLRRAPLASFGAVQTTVTEVGHGYVQLEYAEIDPAGEPDSDAALLAHGWACVTPLTPVCEAAAVDLAGLHLDT